MKLQNLLAIAILACVLFPAASAQQAYLQSGNSPGPSPAITAQWTNTQAPLACPCQTVNLPIQITNNLNQGVTVATTLSMQQGLTGAISQSAQIPALSTGSATVTMSVSCDAPTGNQLFWAQLSPTSADGTLQASQQLTAEVDVLACSSLTLAPTQVNLQCPQNALAYNFVLSNNGVYNQSGTLYVTGVKPSMYVLSPTTFNLLSGQSEQVTVLFTPPFTYQPTPSDTLTLNAQGSGTFQQATVPLTSVTCPVPSTPSNYSSGNTFHFYLPPTGGSGTTGAGTLNSAFTGFFTYVRSDLSLNAVALLIVSAIIFVLAYTSSRPEKEEPASKGKTDSDSMDKVRRIALAVQNY
jgi:hypothetical protein